MGGHLLHLWGLPEKRVSRADFDRLMVEVVAKLSGKFAELLADRRVEPLKFFAEKQDFGDLDVAVEVFSKNEINWPVLLKEVFGLSYVHVNGNCLSFPVEGFQVDVLLFDSEVFDAAQVYYAYESGNFMGRVADQLGLSYGHRGLYLQLPLSYLRDGLPEHQYAELLLSRDPSVVFELLGFDYQRFLQGFSNFEEMAQWVADSKYFAPEVFGFDALNSINRTRNRKRPVYAKFVEWAGQQPKRNDLPSKEVVREVLFESSLVLRLELARLRREQEVLVQRRAKFNGNLVREWFGLEQAPLGKFMALFKKSFGDFDALLDKLSAEEVKSKAVAFFNCNSEKFR